MSGEIIPAGESLPEEGRPIADWQTMIDSFLDTVETESTRATYAPTLRALSTALGGIGPAAVTAAELAAWARSVRDDVEAATISPNTGKRRVMSVKAFFRFAYQVGQSNINKDVRAFVLKPPKEQVLKPFQVLNEEDQDKLLAAADGQERRMIATLMYAGLRVSELCKLRAGEYFTDEDGQRWFQVRGKGNESRVVPVGPKLAAELGPPIPNGNGHPLFASREGNGHYTRGRINQIVEAAIKVAGIEKPISPHALRHTAAITWLKARVPLPVVQKWLGHKSLATTQKYVDHIENGEAHKYMP